MLAQLKIPERDVLAQFKIPERDVLAQLKIPGAARGEERKRSGVGIILKPPFQTMKQLVCFLHHYHVSTRL